MTIVVSRDAEGVAYLETGDDQAARARRWHRRAMAQRVAYAFSRPDDRLMRGDRVVYHRVTACGKARSDVDDVVVKMVDGKAVAGGLMSCGSIWACPTCSLKIRVRRRFELEAAARRHVLGGGRLAMLTLTVRHREAMPLVQTLAALSEAWRLMSNRTGWRKLYCSTVGYVRSVEITYGEAGWHPHFHVLLFVKPGVGEAEVSLLTNGLFDSWAAGARSVLGVSPTAERGLDLAWFGDDAESAALYVSKAAAEITQADSKSGRDPFALLDENNFDDAERFHEYATSTVGLKAITWSRGLRARLELAPELPDTEVAQDDEDVGESVMRVPGRDWNRLDVVGRLAVLEACEFRYRFGLGAPRDFTG